MLFKYWFVEKSLKLMKLDPLCVNGEYGGVKVGLLLYCKDLGLNEINMLGYD
jgi:hypothetical protein